jgi:hypothetical protein
VLQLSYGLHCVFILLLLEFNFFNSGFQLPGECSDKGHKLLVLDVPFVRYGFHTDVGRSTRSLRKMGTLCFIQELVMV